MNIFGKHSAESCRRIVSIATFLLMLPLSLFSGTVRVHAAMPVGLLVSLPDDGEMTCGQIMDEIGTMDKLILEAQDVRRSSEEARMGVGVAKTVGTFLIGSVTGTIGILAAGQLAGHAADNRADDADTVGDIARQRRSLMMGLHAAKKCGDKIPDAPPPVKKAWPFSKPDDAGGAADAAGRVKDVEPAAGASTGDNNTPVRPPFRHEYNGYNG